MFDLFLIVVVIIWLCVSVAVVFCFKFSVFVLVCFMLGFFFSSRRRHTRYIGDWSSDVCSSDLSKFQLMILVLGFLRFPISRNLISII